MENSRNIENNKNKSFDKGVLGLKAGYVKNYYSIGNLAVVYRTAKKICRKCYCRLPPDAKICRNCHNTDLRFKKELNHYPEKYTITAEFYKKVKKLK